MSSAAERETIIHFSDEGETATIYTAASHTAELLISKGLEPIKVDTYRNKPVGWTFEIPKWSVRVKPGQTAIYVGGRKGRKSDNTDTATDIEEETEEEEGVFDREEN